MAFAADPLQLKLHSQRSLLKPDPAATHFLSWLPGPYLPPADIRYVLQSIKWKWFMLRSSRLQSIKWKWLISRGSRNTILGLSPVIKLEAWKHCRQAIDCCSSHDRYIATQQSSSFWCLLLHICLAWAGTANKCLTAGSLHRPGNMDHHHDWPEIESGLASGEWHKRPIQPSRTASKN